MTRTVVLNVVGLTPAMVKSGAPNLARWAAGAALARIRPAFPAVTCTAQSDYLTGRYPTTHGIVGNGWYAREDAEIRFWKQSNKLVQAPKIWERARGARPHVHVRQRVLVVQHVFDRGLHRHAAADVSGRRPKAARRLHRARRSARRASGEARDVPALQLLGTESVDRVEPVDCGIGEARRSRSSRRRSRSSTCRTSTTTCSASVRAIRRRRADVRQVDDLCGDLIAFYEARGVQVVILSEYGLCDVTTPVHLNRVLRQHGLVAVREELGLEVLDPGASAAFVVADHQVAHVYVNDPSRQTSRSARSSRRRRASSGCSMPRARAAHRIDHARAGDLVAIAEPKAWFTYYYWLDDRRAPDFARTVDIHRKPGYDPVELLLDPAIRVPALSVGWRLAKKSLGIPNADGRDPARRDARQGLPRPAGPRGATTRGRSS